MNFSVKVQYGLQALLELALSFGGGVIQIKDIAESQKIPIRFLEQLLLVLKRQGLVVSNRGMHGGYVLSKHPSEIKLLEVVEALDSAIELATIKMKKAPILLETFEKLQNNIKDYLSGITLEDLVLKKRQKERSYIYNI
jgi:Rrf2 family protein